MAAHSPYEILGVKPFRGDSRHHAGEKDENHRGDEEEAQLLDRALVTPCDISLTGDEQEHKRAHRQKFAEKRKAEATELNVLADDVKRELDENQEERPTAIYDSSNSQRVLEFD